jgi:hypothetical protein
LLPGMLTFLRASIPVSIAIPTQSPRRAGEPRQPLRYAECWNALAGIPPLMVRHQIARDSIHSIMGPDSPGLASGMRDQNISLFRKGTHRRRDVESILVSLVSFSPFGLVSVSIPVWSSVGYR